MKSTLTSIDAEYRRYKALAESAMAQLPDADLARPGPGGGNSVAVVVWHIGGNLASRFTDFLTTDGEKPWRMREAEFADRSPGRTELLAHWENGWGILFGSLAELTVADLERTVTIRGEGFAVHEALQRSLAHVAYHVGQIVYLAREWRGSQWEFLSIPPGGTEAYNLDPNREHAAEHTSKLEDRRSP